MQVATSSFRRPSHVHAAADIGAHGFDQERFDPGMDILEPVIKDLFGNPFAVELEERGKELLCDIGAR